MKQHQAEGCLAQLGENVIIEPGARVGHLYREGARPAVVGDGSVIRSGAILYADVIVGRWFQTGHNTVIRAKVRCGDYCTVSNQSTIEGLVRMGKGVRVMSHVYIPSRTWFGDHVFVGPGTVFLNDRLPGRVDPAPTPRGATIEDEVMIGGGCTINPGVRIGRRSFIASGAVVVKDVPPESFVMGVPGRVQPLPEALCRDNSRSLTEQPIDLWHPDSPGNKSVNWPEDWGEQFP